MGGLEGYLPVMAVIGLQCHYAVLYIITRVALLKGMSPRVFVAYRNSIATLTLAPMAFSPKRRHYLKTSLRLRNFSLMFVTSLIGITANQNAYFEGLYLASSTVASAMTNLVPVITFVIATIVGFEKIDMRSLRSIAKMIGIVLCVGGALTMALLKGKKPLHMEFLPSKHLIGMQGADNWLLGCLLLFACSVFWSFWMIIQVQISSSCPDHLCSTFLLSFLAAVESTTFRLLFEHDFQAWSLGSALEYSSCLYAGIGTAVSFFIQTWSISQRGPLFCAMFSPLCTVITAMIAATFLHEELYVGSLIGAAAVIIGLYIVLWGKAKEHEGIREEVQLNMENDEISCNIDLEEPLLSDKSEHAAESKINS